MHVKALLRRGPITRSSVLRVGDLEVGLIFFFLRHFLEANLTKGTGSL